METTITFNSTPSIITNSTQINYTERIDWIIPIAINIFLIFLSIWVLISLVHYGIKTKKWSQTERSNLEKLNAGLVYTSAVVCAIACLFRYIFTMIHFNIGFSDDEDLLCDILSDLTSTFYTLVLFSSALFSWSRQRFFYSNRMLNVNYTKTMRFFSKFSIGIIVVFGLGVLIFSVVPNDHPSSPDGCTYKVANNYFRIAYWVCIVVALTLGQVTLFCLFVHALRTVSLSSKSTFKMQTRSRSSGGYVSVIVFSSSNHHPTENSYSDERVKNAQNNCNAATGERNSAPTRSPKKNVSKADTIQRILRITFILATISLLVDILIQVFSFFISSGNRRILTTLLSISSFLNLLFIVFAFKQYKEMLFSCFYKNQ